MTDPGGLGIPVDPFVLARLEALEKVSDCSATWGRAADGRFFVDLVDLFGELRGRHHGESLHLAVGEALRRVGGHP